MFGHQHLWPRPLTIGSETYQRCIHCGRGRAFDLNAWQASEEGQRGGKARNRLKPFDQREDKSWRDTSVAIRPLCLTIGGNIITLGKVLAKRQQRQ